MRRGREETRNRSGTSSAQSGLSGHLRLAGRAIYDLAKVPGKGLVDRVPERRCDECRPEQLRALCGNVLLREQVIKPVLAGMALRELPPAPPRPSLIDQHHAALRAEFARTCQTLELAA
jgi:hypothetical protein